MAAQSDLRFTISAGPDAFAVVEFHPGEVLDRPAFLTFWHGEQHVRYFHGSISSFQQGETGFRPTRQCPAHHPEQQR